MKRFILYRLNPPENYERDGYANPPEVPQLEGVIFSDGTVCVRWLTSKRSHSIWNSFDDFNSIHGHPEYNSVFKFLDE